MGKVLQTSNERNEKRWSSILKFNGVAEGI